MKAIAFAELANQCDNTWMQKPFIIAVAALAFGLILLGNAQAQQTPASGAQAAPATKPTPAPAAKPAQSPEDKPAAPVLFKSDKEKDSYAVGLNIGLGLRKQPVDLDTASVLRGMKDALSDSKLLLTPDEVGAALNELQGEAQKNAEERNMKEADDFLAANKTKDGVVTLPSGLQYKILTAGTGAKPAASDTVVCNYSGRLINGTEFDSSYKRGKPAEFQVGGVIKGWTEALQLMPVGSKWQLYIPSDLAYGARGAGGGAIGPNQALIFDVELISIKGK
jgi:FKBP-type peptidyl-prolyl cis-trans isomerase FklB